MTRILSIAISQEDFDKLAIPGESIGYDEFVKKIKKQLALEALRRCQIAAEKAGISEMTLDEINAEIKAARHAKARH